MRALFVLSLFAAPLIAADPVAWRSEYSPGRKEAADANKAVCLVIGSDNCFYCKKLEASTLVDAVVSTSLRQSYVAIKVDAAREPELIKALKIQLYPTTVLAGPDGTIHAIIKGYITAEQMREHLKQTLVVIADDERMTKDVAMAKLAFDVGDTAKASALLRPIAEMKARPQQATAKELLEKVERAAAAKAVVQAVRPQALLEVAKTLHDHQRLADALDVAAEVIRSHPGTAEAKAAQAMIDDIRTNADKLRTASRQADEKAASLQLALSESLLKAGDVAGARSRLEQVVRLAPSGPHAEAAQTHLAKLRQPATAVPASLKR